MDFHAHKHMFYPGFLHVLKSKQLCPKPNTSTKKDNCFLDVRLGHMINFIKIQTKLILSSSLVQVKGFCSTSVVFFSLWHQQGYIKSYSSALCSSVPMFISWALLSLNIHLATAYLGALCCSGLVQNQFNKMGKDLFAVPFSNKVWLVRSDLKLNIL